MNRQADDTPLQRRPRTTADPDRILDLVTQLEEILHAVWLAEADWRLDDRIDLSTQT